MKGVLFPFLCGCNGARVANTFFVTRPHFTQPYAWRKQDFSWSILYLCPLLVPDYRFLQLLVRTRAV